MSKKKIVVLTGAGMSDCKKALTNTDGDMDGAVEWLKENGLAKAEKKANSKKPKKPAARPAY